MRVFFVAAALVFLPLVAEADRGGWVSSGGELFRFGKNPWFLKNVKDVEYCVDVDSATVTASRAIVSEVVREAIVYWQNEFRPQSTSASSGYAALGTQNFIEVPSCSSAIPLQFRVGVGALLPLELEHLEDPRKFVGVSIRKEYDNVDLKGAGVVYIASDKGASAYNAKPNSTHLFPEAWRERKLLLYAIIHELGHVFGIPHTGSGLMSEVFLEQLLHKRFYQFYLDNPVVPFLLPPLVFESCAPFSTFNAGFFQVPADAACIRMEGSSAGGSYEWNVFYRKAKKDPIVATGNIKASPIMQLAAAAKPASIIQLPGEQKVFSLAERQMNSFLIGPVFTETTARGIFTSISSRRPHDLQIELRPESIVMTGIVGGRMVPVFVYSPPSLINQMFPTGP
jgi:hypothetical protein